MNEDRKPCVARLQIGKSTVEIAESFLINGDDEGVEYRLGIAIGQSLAMLRSTVRFDTQSVLRHAGSWAQTLASRGSRELSDEAEKSATQL